MTGFPVAVLPGKPGKPTVQPGSITAVIMWENGDSGNVPFEKFEIQSLTDGKQYVLPFVVNVFKTANAMIFNHVKGCFL